MMPLTFPSLIKPLYFYPVFWSGFLNKILNRTVNPNFNRPNPRTINYCCSIALQVQVLGHTTNNTNKSEAFFQVQFCTTEELLGRPYRLHSFWPFKGFSFRMCCHGAILPSRTNAVQISFVPKTNLAKNSPKKDQSSQGPILSRANPHKGQSSQGPILTRTNPHKSLPILPKTNFWEGPILTRTNPDKD